MYSAKYCWAMLLHAMVKAPRNLSPGEKRDWLDMLDMGAEMYCHDYYFPNN